MPVRYLDLHGDPVPGSQVLRHIESDGIVLLRDAGRQALLTELAPWVDVHPHPDADVAGVTTVRPSPALAERVDGGAFTRNALTLHTDRSTAARPPSILACVLTRGAPEGGSSLFFDGRIALDRLAREATGPAGLARLRLRLVDDTLLPLFECRAGRWAVRYRDDRIGAPEPAPGAESLMTLLADLFRSAVRVTLGSGDGYLVHNLRYLHGRDGFAGDRELLRVLGTVKRSSPYQGMNDGFSYPSRP